MNMHEQNNIHHVHRLCIPHDQTTTSVTLLKLWVKDLGKGPALASAYSNVAVDQMLGGLIKRGVRAIRIGDPEKVNNDLYTKTMKYAEEHHPLTPDLELLREHLKQVRNGVPGSGIMTSYHLKELSMTYKRIKKLEKKIVDDILDNCDVVLATCIGAGATVLSDRLFSLILVDECTQATEPSCLIPLVKSRPDSHVVMIGDQCQLPPTLSNDKLKYTGLKISLFERMLQIPNEKKTGDAATGSNTAPAYSTAATSASGTDAASPGGVVRVRKSSDDVAMTSFSSKTTPFMGISPSRLLIQYRMHPLISSWPNQAFYSGHLKDGVTADKRPPPRGFPWPEAGPVCMVSCKAWEDHEIGRSKKNVREASLVFGIVQKLLSSGELTPADIGIVTPYVGQVRVLREMFGYPRRRGFKKRDQNDSQNRTPAEDEELGVIVQEGVYKDLEIMSVDGYQGREKEVIVFSCVRSNKKGNVGFLADRRRLNVAITRAVFGTVCPHALYYPRNSCETTFLCKESPEHFVICVPKLPCTSSFHSPPSAPGSCSCW